jgi:hypothetical protein
MTLHPRAGYQNVNQSWPTELFRKIWITIQCTALLNRENKMNTKIWQFNFIWIYSLHIREKRVRVSYLSWSVIYQHFFDISWLADEAKWDHMVEDSISFILLLSLRHTQLSQFLPFHKRDWLLSCFVELYTSSAINVYYASMECLHFNKKFNFMLFALFQLTL